MTSPNHDSTASLMTPAKLKRATEGRAGAAASPSAWLDQMAADAGHQQLARMAQLTTVLQAQASARALQTPQAALSDLEQALSQLDFSLLQSRGWWARTTGKSKTAGEQFAAQFEQAGLAVSRLATQAQALADQQQGDAAAAERALVEFEVEYRAVEKIVEQGARWLQDMRTQLKERHAAAADAQVQQQVKDDAARCEILVSRLKLLRASATAAQQVHQQIHAVAAQRTVLLVLLRQAVAAQARAWQLHLAPLACAAAAGDAGALSVQEPVETHRKLNLCVKQAALDSASETANESVLAAALSALAGQLARPG